MKDTENGRHRKFKAQRMIDIERERDTHRMKRRDNEP
jgi:hypothetical protein